MATPTTPAVPNPGGSASTPSGTSPFAQGYALGASGNVYANMKTFTDTTSTTQTSPQDVEALINATMQSMVGRNATPQELQTYGAELLAAEKSNFGTFNEQTTYGPTGKRADITGGQTSTGIDPQGFLQSLIGGSADAQSYKLATSYFSAMQQALQGQENI
jgi:hypothetical protein